LRDVPAGGGVGSSYVDSQAGRTRSESLLDRLKIVLNRYANVSPDLLTSGPDGKKFYPPKRIGNFPER